MHTAIRQICAGEVGSPADVIGSRCTADEPVPECPVEAGGVVSGAWVWGWAGVSALPVCVPSADSGVVSGVVLEVAGEDAVAAAFGCLFGIAVCGTATAALRCRPAVAGGQGRDAANLGVRLLGHRVGGRCPGGGRGHRLRR